MLADDVKLESTLSLPEQETESLKVAPNAQKGSGTGGFTIKRGPSPGQTSVLRPLDAEKILEEYPELTFLTNLPVLNTPLLVFTENAERTIKEHIFWGEKRLENLHEQGGILIGRPFSTGNSILGLAEYAIPAILSQASFAYLRMGTESWARMLGLYDVQYKDKGLYVIGWFHTHPNSLPTFMSSTDMGTQRTFFYQDWHFSAVMNPQRHLLSCFHSAEAAVCDYYPPDYTTRMLQENQEKR